MMGQERMTHKLKVGVMIIIHPPGKCVKVARTGEITAGRGRTISRVPRAASQAPFREPGTGMQAAIRKEGQDTGRGGIHCYV